MHLNDIHLTIRLLQLCVLRFVVCFYDSQIWIKASQCISFNLSSQFYEKMCFLHVSHLLLFFIYIIGIYVQCNMYQICSVYMFDKSWLNKIWKCGFSLISSLHLYGYVITRCEGRLVIKRLHVNHQCQTSTVC